MAYYASILAINVQSFVIRSIFVYLMRYTYFKTESARVRFMTVSIFGIFFLNYGIMYLVAPMDIDISFLILGVYTEFNTSWYVNIGDLIVITMLILAISPPITLFCNWVIKNALRQYD